MIVNIFYSFFILLFYHFIFCLCVDYNKTAWPITGQAVFIIYQAFSRRRVMVGWSQTSEGPKYWMAPG